MILTIFIIIISAVCVSCQQCPGSHYQVIQPRYQTVNLDGSAFISCEHNSNVTSIVDVRLNHLWQDGQRDKRTVLCQKGKTDCENIAMFLQSTNKSLFIILNVGPEAMDITYECEFTMDICDSHYMKRGPWTRLLPAASEGQKDTEKVCTSLPCPPPPQHSDLKWILIGLLSLLFLYGCVITCIIIRLRMTNKEHRFDPDNTTYVEMRKGPLMTK